MKVRLVAFEFTHGGTISQAKSPCVMSRDTQKESIRLVKVKLVGYFRLVAFVDDKCGLLR